MHRIFAIILNYNGCQMTLDCLQSLKKMVIPEHVDFQTIVVDNNSHDDSRTRIPQEFPQCIFLSSDQNLGFTGGNNLGFEYAKTHGADYVMLLNNDTIVDKNLVSELFICLKKTPKAAAVCPKIYFAPGHEFHKDRYSKKDEGNVLWYAGGDMDWANVASVHRGLDEIDTGQYEQVAPISFATGCCVLIDMKVFPLLEKRHSGLPKIASFALFERSFLFDPRYFLYYEDAELSTYFIRNGFHMYYVPTAKLWHINSGSSGSGSNLHDYFLTRNRLLFGLTFAPLRTKIALLRQSVRQLYSGRPWQKQGIKDFLFRKFGKGNYPIQ